MEQQHWDIFYHDRGGWSWRCADHNGAVHESHVWFPTREACVADAKAHGYPDKECRARSAG